MYTEGVAPDVVAPHEERQNIEDAIKPLDTVIALYDFPSTLSSHLPLRLGDTIQVLSKSETGWWDGLIISGNEVTRGWFPLNYVRSVNYVQPILDGLKTNKEIDTLTAANTAANVLIPSFANLLQKNLVDSEKTGSLNTTRKSSVVSFASSDTSRHDDSKDDDVFQRTAKNSIETESPITGAKKFNLSLVSVEEAEAASESYYKEHNKCIVWLPRCTFNGDIVYCSEQLKMYCNEIPLINPGNNFEANIKIEHPSLEFIESMALDNNVDQGEISNLASRLQNDRNLSNSSKDFDPLKRSPHSSISTQNSYLSYHHFRQPLFAYNSMFYMAPYDISSWIELRRQLIYHLDLSVKALKDYNREQFGYHLGFLNRALGILVTSVRLMKNDYAGTSHEAYIRKKIKKSTFAFSYICINGMLHLGVMYHSNLTPESKILSSEISKPRRESNAIRRTSVGTIPSIPSISTIKRVPDESRHSFDFSSNHGQYNVTYLEQADYEKDILKNNVNGITKVFLQLSKGKKTKRSDYCSSDVSSDDEGEDRYNILPQSYPRMVAKEFNGGNWCNPFFSSTNSVLNASGDNLKTKYKQKIIIDREVHEQIKTSCDELRNICKETLSFLSPEKQHLYYNDQLKGARNTQILRIIYRYLHQASITIDILESFDFTVFQLVRQSGLFDAEYRGLDKAGTSEKASEKNSIIEFDYPVVLTFFDIKQAFHNLISKIVIATQSLTLEDPDVFNNFAEDDTLPAPKPSDADPFEMAIWSLSNLLINQSKAERGYAISVNTDTILHKYLTEGLELLSQIDTSVKQLIEERETVLNYVTRVMHDDFNVQILLAERQYTLQTDKSEEHSYFNKGSRNNDVPWYLEGDEEYDLLLDMKGNIKGGMKEALIAHLTHHDFFDSKFNTAFLLTFSTMLSLDKFIKLLIGRFNIEAPEGLSFDEYNTWIAKKLSPIRLRVLNIMKLLLQKYWTDSYYNEQALKKWLDFIKSPQVQSFSISKMIQSELEVILNHKRIQPERQPSVPLVKPPAPLFKHPMRRLKLIDIEYVELARQLTLREFKMYCKITKYECLMKVWGKASGLHENIQPITEFIKASNELTNFVAYLILRKQDLRKRVQLIRYFVQTADKCRQFNNFSSMTAIISALYSSSIHRLKKTWQLVSGPIITKLENMNKLMNSSRNFNEYRDVLTFIGSEPCVPFFGVYLSDLTFIYHGNPNYLLDRSRMINFAKRAKTADILTGIDRFKSTGYNLQEVPEIQKFLDLWLDKCPTIKEQYQLSLNIEPRDPGPVNNQKSLKNSSFSNSQKS